jgi:hypothetical protein
MEIPKNQNVIWEIILRDFWGAILRGPQVESRIILSWQTAFWT